MATYRIIGRTNSYIAQRDSIFRGKTTIVIEDNLTLKEAQSKLIEFFCEDYDCYEYNWGMIRCHYPHDTWSRSDGTRGYEYDLRLFEIEEYE